MGKWLAAASVAVIALLVLIWLQLRSPAEAAIATDHPAAPAPTAVEIAKKQELAAIGQQVAAATAQTGKVSPASDEFFYHFYDLQPAMLTKQAAKCYTGGIHRVHRNQKVKLVFTNRIKDGEVTVEDVKLSDESTIDDKPLVDCFINAVKGTHWHDDTLPDWSGPDELIIRPERGMKKYTEENMKYEGDGPDFTDRSKVPGAT